MTLFQGAPVAAATATVPTVNWRRDFNAFCFQKPNPAGGAWLHVPLSEPFAMDIFRAKHGWEVWHDKVRQVVVAPISAPFPVMPSGPDKAKPFFSVPVYSKELGGEWDLVVKDACSAPFVDFVKSVAEVAKLAQDEGSLVVPIVNVTTGRADDYSTIPAFALIEWDSRPATWPLAIVSF